MKGCISAQNAKNTRLRLNGLVDAVELSTNAKSAGMNGMKEAEETCLEEDGR